MSTLDTLFRTWYLLCGSKTRYNPKNQHLGSHMSDEIKGKEATVMLVSRVFSLFSGVTTFRALVEKYVLNDRALHAQGKWDPRNPNLIVNKIKSCLIDMDPVYLPEVHSDYRADILWSWYRKAIPSVWMMHESIAGEKHELACMYLSELMQMEWSADQKRQLEHAQLARIWLFLHHGDHEEAEQWIPTLKSLDHQKMAREVLNSSNRSCAA
ncbi:MAG: hypothetical protein JWO00_560 [Candidatus Parcubacteria bacterium]|nr:hypothetical protein [Candidatus Parcubacteria bacterium]